MCILERLIIKGIGYYNSEMMFVVVILVSKMFVGVNIDFVLYIMVIIKLFFIRFIIMMIE